LSFKILYLNPCGQSVGPKRAACTDENNTICCVWWPFVCQDWYDVAQPDEFYKNYYSIAVTHEMEVCMYDIKKGNALDIFWY